MKYFFFLIIGFFPFLAISQQISYSKPEREDIRFMSHNTLDIIGKFGNDLSILKQIRNKYFISIYDDELKLKANADLNFLPDDVLSVDFVTYQAFSYIIYQFQKGKVIYCKAGVLKANGKLTGEPVVLDSTGVNFFSDKQIYHVIASEDKSKIMIYKIHTEKYVYNFTTLLFDAGLHLIHKSVFGSFLETQHDIFNSFLLDNEGNFVFTKGLTAGATEIFHQLVLITKTPRQDGFNVTNLDLSGNYLNVINLQIDNINKQYIINSFFFTKRPGNIEGLYTAIWNTKVDSLTAEHFTPFSDSLRMLAKSKTGAGNAFNDYYIKNIILKKDGGYILTAEDYTIHSRVREWYADQNISYSSYDYLFPTYIPPGGPYRNNIIMLNINNKGEILWSNVIDKSQYCTNACLSFCIVSTGNEVHFLYNEQVRHKEIMNEQTLSSSGNISKRKPLKQLDFEYQFIPMFSAQISSSEIIILCKYRNYICLAKVKY